MPITKDKSFAYKYFYACLYPVLVDQSLQAYDNPLLWIRKVFVSINPEIFLRKKQTTSLKSVWERLIGDLFYERKDTQLPLITHRFFVIIYWTKKHISCRKGKMQSNFSKYYPVPCGFFFFFSVGMRRAATNSSTHLSKAAVALGCLSSCCFIESSLYEAYYPCIIVLVCSSSPASSLLQVTTAALNWNFSCACNISFELHSLHFFCNILRNTALPFYYCAFSITSGHYFHLFFFFSLCYIFKIRKWRLWSLPTCNQDNQRQLLQAAITSSIKQTT